MVVASNSRRTNLNVGRTKSSGVGRTKSASVATVVSNLKIDATTKLLWALALLTLVREVYRFSNRSSFSIDAEADKKYQPAVHYVVVEPVPKRLAPNMPEVEFPRACTGQDLDLIRLQLPSTLCMKKSKKLRTNQCSFNFATRCPNPIWFNDQYLKTAAVSSGRSLEAAAAASNVVTIGCGSSLPLAVNTLRMISGSPKFDITTFVSTFGAAALKAIVSENPDKCPVPPHVLSDQSIVNDKAVMHCIESKSDTFRPLQSAVQKLHWQERLIVQDQSERKKFGSVLQEFFVDKHASDSSQPVMIDMLRIGGDEMTARILANEKLVLQSRVKYVEFEYSYKEGWKDNTLSETVSMLRQHGFVCYWSGTHGNLWRLTDCFMSYYDKKFWSNVACVNLATAEPLATRMEEMAQATMQKQQSISYSSEKTVGTDGKVEDAALLMTEEVAPLPEAIVVEDSVAAVAASIAEDVAQN